MVRMVRMVRIWYVYGTYMVRIWYVYRTYIVRIWYVYRTYMVRMVRYGTLIWVRTYTRTLIWGHVRQTVLLQGKVPVAPATSSMYMYIHVAMYMSPY